MTFSLVQPLADALLELGRSGGQGGSAAAALRGAPGFSTKLGWGLSTSTCGKSAGGKAAAGSGGGLSGGGGAGGPSGSG